MIKKSMTKSGKAESRFRKESSFRLVFLTGLISLCVIWGCSRPIKPQSDFITVKVGDLTVTRYFDIMDKTTFEGEEAIRLSDFIDSSITIYPQIYAYRIIGSDGFYAAKKGSPDNIWEHLQKGYLKLNTRRSAFEPSLDLLGRYYVKDVVAIELLRKIDTKFKGEEEFTFSLIVNMNVATYADLTDSFYNGRPGIRLSDFVDTLISSPENYTYNLATVKGDEKTYSWLELQTGWWLLNLDMTKFLPDLGTDSRMHYLEKIELIEKNE